MVVGAKGKGKTPRTEEISLTLTHGSSQNIHWHLGMALNLAGLSINGTRPEIEEALKAHELVKGSGMARCVFLVCPTSEGKTVVGLKSIDGNPLDGQHPTVKVAKTTKS